MSPLIYSLVPRTYSKKNHKQSIEFRDVDNFIVELRRRIVDCWNCRFEVDSSNGTGYKLKFEQFEKKFLKNSDFVCYIVNSTSEGPFKNCLEKLLKSCKHKEKLKNIIVLSLDLLSITELDCTPIKYIYFGDDWLSENACQWIKLENILKNQANIDPYDEEKNKLKSHYLTIPIPINGRKSPSKIKNFFHSLPSKFDIDKTRSLFLPKTDKEFIENTGGSHHDIRLPDINVSDIDQSKHEKKDHTPKHKPKDDHSKLSFNSLFRKRSKKTRDSGLSMGSSNSNGSSSRNSESIANCGSISADPIFDCKEHALTYIKHSPQFHNASVMQTEKHKARIENFKTKAHKAIRSTSCLSNNRTKTSKYQVKEVMNKVIDFSTAIISASSEIGNRSENINDNRKRFDYRGHSEPLMKLSSETNSDPQLNTRIKYYSWNEDSLKENEFIEDKSSSNNLENNHIILEKLTCRDISESYEQDNMANVFEELDNSFNDGSPFSLNNKNKCEDENAIIDDEIFFTSLKLSNSELQNENENHFDSAIYESPTSYETFLNQHPDQSIIENHSDDDNHKSDSSEVSNNSFTLAPVGTPTSNVDVTKDDPMESLNVLIRSIQISCEEMRAARKSEEHIDEILYTNEELDDEFVDDSDQSIVSMDANIKEANTEFEECSENLEEHKTIWLESEITSEKKESELALKWELEESEITSVKKESELAFKWELEDLEAYREMSPELIAVADSIENKNFYSYNLHRTTQNWIRNPYIVTGLFAATTYFAPVWCTYIPRNASFLNLISGTLQYLLSNEIVQSIPNQIISTSRNGVVVATQTIKRFLILLPSAPWPHMYRALPV